MTYAEDLAAFAQSADYKDISEEARSQLKLRILDSIGCMIGALSAEPIQTVRTLIDDFGGKGRCTLVGGGQTAPDRAALYNGALLRYLDFMDNFMGKKQSGHPSDNFAPVLAAAEYADSPGKDFLAALALAYSVEIKLLEEMPVEEAGFDHTVQLAFSMTAGMSRALRLDKEKTANALAISGTAYQGLVATRSGYISQWKGLASANEAQNVVNTTFLAMRGITGPDEVFEGPNGLLHAVGSKAKLAWSKEDLNLVTRTSIKKYNAEVHTQSAIEAVLQLRREHNFSASDVDHVEVITFIQAYRIVGAGAEAGNKHDVHTKEQADHSLPYVIAVAMLDGEVTPRQYLPARINKSDVQELLKKVETRTQSHIGKKAFAVLDTYTQVYPDEMPVKVTVKLKDGRELVCEQRDYEGFANSPMTREAVLGKFDSLAGQYASEDLRSQIIATVDDLDNRGVRDLTSLLGQVPRVAS